jgi:hypothetical protein
VTSSTSLISVGRIRSRRDIADQSLGSIGSDGQQTTATYIGW